MPCLSACGPRHNGTVKRRRALLWASALPALVLLLWLPGLLNRRHFDDPLFQRYYDLIAKQRNSAFRGVYISEMLHHWGYCPGETLAPDLDFGAIRRWESRYGDDPKYWELRASMLGCDPDMIEAFRRGVFSEGMLEAANTWEVDKTDPPLALELCDQAIACDPGNSYWYYRKSDLLLMQGRQAAALDLLRQGNAAAGSRRPRPYPLNQLLQDSRWVRTDTDKLVAGTIVTGTYVDVTEDERSRQIATMVAQQAAANKDAGRLDAYYLRFIRQGRLCEDSWDSWSDISRAAGQLELMLVDKDSPRIRLTPSQTREFNDYRAALQALQYENLMVTQNYYVTKERKAHVRWTESMWEAWLLRREHFAAVAKDFDRLLPAPYTVWFKGGTTGLELDAEFSLLAEQAQEYESTRVYK